MPPGIAPRQARFKALRTGRRNRNRAAAGAVCIATAGRSADNAGPAAPPMPGPGGGAAHSDRCPMNLADFCRAIPKAELHVHFTGAVPLDTLLSLARRNGIALPPCERPEDLYARGENFDRVLPTLKLVCQALRTPDDFREAVYATQQHAADCGVRYREMFWNPTDHRFIGGIGYAKAVDGMIAGLREAERDFGIVGRLIPSIDRESSAELGHEMVEEAVRHRRDETIGIGMDYLETGNPPEKFWKAYRLAGQHGLKRTAHAGEFGEPACNIETALDLLGCERIDHGYTVLDSPNLLRRCEDEGILFTVVPTNSYYSRTLRGQDFATVHPIAAMAQTRLKIMPNSDDPPLHHTDPANAFAEMVTTFGLPLARLRDMVANGIDGAWVDESVRREWRADWLATFDRLAPEVEA